MNISKILNGINEDLRQMIIRVPFTISLLFLISILGSFFLTFDDGDLLGRLFLSGTTSILLTLITKIHFESYKIKKIIYLIESLASILIGLLIFIYLPEDLDSKKFHWIFIFFVCFTFAILLLLSILPYLLDRLGYKNYNIRLFISLCSSLFISILLFASISLLFVALDQLFKIDVGNDIYKHLCLWCFGFFGVARFISDIPVLPYKDTKPSDNNFLSFIVTYLGLPITIIYGIVAYAYLIRNLTLNEETIKWINPFMIWFFSIGNITYLLNTVLNTEKKVNLLFNKYWLWFVLPLIIYFFVNILIQTKEFGLDEGYYFLTLMGIWLLVSTLYLMIKKDNDYRIINITGICLCISAIIPWPFNAWNAPVISQKKMVINNFEDQKILVNASLTPLDENIDIDENILNTIYDLDRKDKLNFLEDYDTNNLIPDTFSIKELLSILSINETFQRNTSKYIDYSFPQRELDLSGYSWSIPIISYSNVTIPNRVNLINENLTLEFDGMTFPIAPFKNELEKGVIIRQFNDSLELKIYIENAYVYIQNGKVKINDIRGLALIKK